MFAAVWLKQYFVTENIVDRFRVVEEVELLLAKRQILFAAQIQQWWSHEFFRNTKRLREAFLGAVASCIWRGASLLRPPEMQLFKNEGPQQ